MLRYLPVAAAVVSCTLWLFSCQTASKEKPVSDSTVAAALPDSTGLRDLRYHDQQQIERVIYGFCEHFDNGDLHKCVEFMDDNIRGEVDGVKLKGKTNWTAKIDSLLMSTRNTHYQPRHLISNMQFYPGINDTVRVTMYASTLWTDLTNGQIQLMQVGYYKGKVVRKDGKWLITVLNSLPDSRLVKQFYQDVQGAEEILR
ncbi:nuclear transport factor 2 family protein [Chitinophaga arvensicola]|uniref:SnoaL-like domain-containing protein n=1 Tax=Chitinophaga arvensicola TaxID=29529 RepID=A0A1I0RLV4_9BACT|nr:nuclear transport factor 2 family protein [Chitinophaga arvensicola]SEW42015.1 SnoaL-like domain-containing protein [Chitinophaga arvensicola]